MSQKKYKFPETLSTISGKSWLLIIPDELSCLAAMGGLLLKTKQQPEIVVNQLICSTQLLTENSQSEKNTELTECIVNSETAQALGIAHSYCLASDTHINEEHINEAAEKQQKLTFSLLFQEKIQRILQHTLADTLFIPHVTENGMAEAEHTAIIWQLIQKMNFQGTIYAYETSLSDSINTLVDVSDTIAEKQKLLEQWRHSNQKLADLVLAGNRARTISLSDNAMVDYVEGFFHFDKSFNKQLFNAINHLLPLYQSQQSPLYQPLISIITRTKDRPRLLQEAVNSIVAQNYPNIELIVVNDGGLDVEQQLQAARSQLYGLNYQNLEQNVGRAAAANIGLLQAKGDFVLFLDDDDLIDIEHLNLLNDAIQKNPAYDVAYCGVRVGENSIFNTPFNKDYLQVFNYLPIHAVLFSRRFIDSGCRFDETLDALEDWDFWIQLSQYGDFYHVDQISGDYRQLGNSDGGTFAVNSSVMKHRYQVLNKWLSHWSIEQFDDILHALRNFPSEKETELHQLASGQYEALEHNKKHITHLEQQINHIVQQKNKLEQQITQLKEENNHTETQLRATEIQLQDVLQSTMWRMSSPLRKILSYLYGLRDRLKAAGNQSQLIKEQSDKLPFDFSKLSAQSDGHHPLFQQLFAQAKGQSEHYVGISPFSARPADNLKYIAFYLPQYHPIPENDEWWGKGFTEWSNVAKATPQFEGHYQPHLPDELGFYDLRLYDVLKRQVELAKHYGIYGFCFHHYWFGGKRLLERPFQHVMEHPELDINFCLCWANENWTRRWDGLEENVLIAQQHSIEDDLAFIKELEPVLKDKRYIRVNGKPLLILYRPSLLPDAKATLELWRNYCRENGVGEIHLVMAQVFGELEARDYGFDAAVEFPPHGSVEKIQEITSQVALYNQQYSGHVYDYKELVARSEEHIVSDTPLYRGIFPGWDNDARKPGKGNSFINSSPLLYQNWLDKVSDYALANPVDNESMVFINAWNEWGEGAHLEPDKKFGYAYLEASAKILQKNNPTLQEALLTTTQKLTKNHETAVVLHLYYPELWEEINSYLKNLGGDFDLYLSVPIGMYQEYLDSILISYPQAHIFAFENRGRDIAPFLEIMRKIWPLDYQYLCKLHSKKSLYFADGAQWRNDLLSKLLGQNENKANVLTTIRAKFDNDASLGLIAPRGYYLPLQPHIGSNQAIMSDMMNMLGEKMQINSHFVAGTMFWCRPDSLRSLASLPLAFADFPDEQGQRDGTPAHALERLFSQMVEQSGYRIMEM